MLHEDYRPGLTDITSNLNVINYAAYLFLLFRMRMQCVTCFLTLQ